MAGRVCFKTFFWVIYFTFKLFKLLNRYCWVFHFVFYYWLCFLTCNINIYICIYIHILYIYIYKYIYVYIYIYMYVWTCSKKSSLFGKSVTMQSSLTFGLLKYWLSSWVIPSVPMIKLKNWSFQFWKSHRKQTKHSGDIYAIFFTVIFMILVERNCMLQKWYSFTQR